jgi:hypothetical protein
VTKETTATSRRCTTMREKLGDMTRRNGSPRLGFVGLTLLSFAAVGLIAPGAVGGVGYAATKTTAAPKSTAKPPAIPTTTAVSATPGPVLRIVAGTAAAKEWTVWSSTGAPIPAGGMLRADFAEAGFFSVSRTSEVVPVAGSGFRISLVPGQADWYAELSNNVGRPFGRTPLSLGPVQANGVQTATVSLAELNGAGIAFSRLYLYSSRPAGSASLAEISLVTGVPVPKTVETSDTDGATLSMEAPVDATVQSVSPPTKPPAKSTTAPKSTTGLPKSKVTKPKITAPRPVTTRKRPTAPATTRPGLAPNPGPAVGSTDPRIPRPGRPQTPGVGSVLTVRAATGACTRKGPWRIMPLGDSLTIGFSDRGFADSYRKTLWELLRARGFRDVDFVGNLKSDDGTFDGEHSGWGGYTTGPDNNTAPNGFNNLYAYISSFNPQPFTLNEKSGKDWVTFADPDIVLLNIGTNDNEGSQAAIERRLGGLVDIISAKAPTARIVLSSLPPSSGNISIAPLVGVVAQNIAKASNGRILYADVRTRMLTGDPASGVEPFQATDWRGDGDEVHLSLTGGAKFAHAWYPAVEAALKGPRCA